MWPRLYLPSWLIWSDMGIGGVEMNWQDVWGFWGWWSGAEVPFFFINGAKIIYDDKLTAPWVNCQLGGNY